MRNYRIPLLLAMLVVAAAGALACEAQKAAPEKANAPAAAAPAPAALDPSRADEEVSGAYEVDPSWPKPMSTWPGHEGWTWGSTQGVFAQNPNRIFVLQRGELPEIKSFDFPNLPKQVAVEVDMGLKGKVRLSVPVAMQALRNASIDITGSPGEYGIGSGSAGVEGKDYRWEHLVNIFDSQGNLVESWTQWDKLLKRPHKIYISPYDPEKRVWIDDDGRNAIFVFSNDGKKLLQTIGIPNEFGEDEKHFHRQTDLAWLPDGTFFVTDGYENTRVVKFDKTGKFLMAWGRKGVAGKETRPGYFNTVHGIAIDNEHRLYINDRANRRIQIYDENGNFIDQWYQGPIAATYHLMMTADQNLWISDGHENYRFYKYDLTGRMLYSWGVWGLKPGEVWGVHQFSVDQEGNLYTAEVDTGRAQKFRPKKGADQARLIGQPAHPAWKE